MHKFSRPRPPRKLPNRSRVPRDSKPMESGTERVVLSDSHIFAQPIYIRAVNFTSTLAEFVSDKFVLQITNPESGVMYSRGVTASFSGVAIRSIDTTLIHRDEGHRGASAVTLTFHKADSSGSITVLFTVVHTNNNHRVRVNRLPPRV